MFCPECGSEYREGVEKCPDCGADLVAELVDERRPGDALVPVLSTHSVGDIAMIRSLLDGSGISYHIQGENALHVRQFVEPAILLVASGDYAQARELLKDLELSFMAVSYHEHDPRKDR